MEAEPDWSNLTWGNPMARAILTLLVLSAGTLPLIGCTDFLGFGDDEGPPVFQTITPNEGSGDVSVLDLITLSFSTRLDRSSLAHGVRLEDGDRVIATEARLLNDRTLVLSPTDPMDFGTEYEVIITPALTSRDGSPFVGTITLAFRTRGMAPPTPNQDSLRRNLEVLAHDSLRGRGSGSPDELAAARYLEARLLSYGLQPAPGGTLQPFQALSRRGDTLLASRNVMAAVPGSGTLANEWLVVGAHYDHIGFRGLENEIGGPNNGADDNGSGTVLILELARLLQAYVEAGGMPETPRRSVLFVGFGAEEEGLLGSCHYVFDAPAVPLTFTRAMLNFDMVGRLRGNELVVSGHETAHGWGDITDNANAVALSLVRPPNGAPGSTDHACFWQAGIPWLGFFTGFHPEYHAQEDDVDLINFQGLERIGSLGFRILTRLMVAPQSLGFTGPIPDLAPEPF